MNTSFSRDLRQAFVASQFYAAPMALRIRHLREAKGWTQEVLAGRAGLSRSQLAMIEVETRPANTLRLNSIAAALGVAPEELFETDERERRVVSILRKLSSDDAETLLRVTEGLASREPQA